MINKMVKMNNIIAYSEKFSRTSFAVFIHFTSTLKINSSKFLNMQLAYVLKLTFSHL